MLIDYYDYCRLGFAYIPEADFVRFEKMAEGAVLRLTCNRVNSDNISEEGMIGVCEAAEVFYDEYLHEKSGLGGRLTGFTNEGYSERYSDDSKLQRTAMQKVEDIVAMYFSRFERFRGVGNERRE